MILPITDCKRTRRGVQSPERDASRVRAHSALHFFSATLLFIAILAPTHQAQAQNLQVNLEAGLLSGVQIGQNGNETVLKRQAATMAFDIGAVLDDEMLEWSLGILMQLEAPVAMAAYPKVRLVRHRQGDAFYAQAGIPWYLSPFRRFGLGMGGGYRHMVGDGFHIFSQGSTEFYFAGGDIPDGQSIITFSVSAGGRVTF